MLPDAPLSTMLSVTLVQALRKLWLPVLFGLYGILALSTVFGARGLLHMQHLSQEQAALESKVFVLLRENEALRACIEQLKTDDAFFEKIVREELGFVRPGELVYRFPASSTAPTQWERACLSYSIKRPPRITAAATTGTEPQGSRPAR